jgi:hypothetical protein
MTPSLCHTYRATCASLTEATTDVDFGSRFLLSGKSSAVKGQRRETWLSERIAKHLVSAGFPADSEHQLGNRGRIDVAILDPHLTCAVEVKVYFCHHCRTRIGHQFLRDTYWDFYKRLFLGVQLQAVLIVADIVSFPAEGGDENLYNAGPLIASLAKRGPVGFDRFESDLRKAFSHICEIYPESGYHVPSTERWNVRHAGASAILRAWTLALNPAVNAEELDALCKATTGAADYERRMRKYGLAPRPVA